MLAVSGLACTLRLAVPPWSKPYGTRQTRLVTRSQINTILSEFLGTRRLLLPYGPQSATNNGCALLLRHTIFQWEKSWKKGVRASQQQAAQHALGWDASLELGTGTPT